MPAYITNPQPTAVHSIYLGDNLTLIGSADLSATTTTIQCAIGPDPSGYYRITLNNSTDQTATVQTAPSDTPSLYEAYSDEGTAITVSTNTSKSFACFGPWLRCTFASAPTVGSLILSR